MEVAENAKLAAAQRASEGMPRANATGRLTLEMSLKPFASDLSSAGVEKTCEHVCDNWRNLAERFDHLAVLLWTSDGSDILDWGGELDAKLEWARSIYFCNNNALEVYEPSWKYPVSVPFRPNPPEMRYRDLKRIISALKRTFRKRFKKSLSVGASIDPGPEFANAEFKLNRHPESLVPASERERMLIAMRFMSHQATLHADSFHYAAFPDGLPEGTSMGTFLGRQFEEACKGLGFDYLWLSNGLGYTPHAWSFKGRCFLGEAFDADAAGRELAMLKKFWLDFRKACPKRRIEARGTNFTVGMDISVDGVSHKAVHELGRIAIAPPNLPNLDEAVGLEMACLMSRIASPITKETLFRFYLNDPWFPCNPWFDRFNRETFDIYCPSSVSRVMPDGSVEPPSNFSILSIDTEKGELLKDEANEVTPHFLRAFREAPDEAGPVVLVYPYDEYHQALEGRGLPLGLPFSHDWLLVHAIASGAPVNTVMSTDTFMKLHKAGRLPDALYLTPAPCKSWPCSCAFLEHVDAGGRMILYGSLASASKELLDALEVKISPDGAEGCFSVETRLQQDFIHMAEAPSSTRPLLHRAVTSGGPLVEKALDNASPLVEARQGGESFAYAVHGKFGAGSLSWLRGSTHFDSCKYELHPSWDSPREYAMSGEMLRGLLAEHGWSLRQEKRNLACRDIYAFIKRHDNAFYFSGHKPDSTSRLWASTPFGAPLFSESETLVKNGQAADSFGKSFYNEVRAFARMQNGVVKCKEMPSELGFSRHVALTGVKGAEILFFPSRKAFAERKAQALDHHWCGKPVHFEWDEKLACMRFESLQTDYLCVLW